MLTGLATAAPLALAGRALAPVSEITRLAAVSGQDLHTRLQLDLPDDELGHLACTFDGMLDRIEDAFDRQRRFTGDAARELRAPLSMLRSRFDLALAHPRSNEEYRDDLREAQADVSLLTGLGNALRYTPRGGMVSIGCRANGAAVRLWVADSGVGIPAEHQARVFDRFSRADTGRTRAAGERDLASPSAAQSPKRTEGRSRCRVILERHAGRGQTPDTPDEPSGRAAGG